MRSGRDDTYSAVWTQTPRRVVFVHQGAKNKVDIENINAVHRPGRTIKVFTSPDNLDVSNVTQGIVWFEPGEVSKPCYAHLISDETIYVIQGKGQVYVDGNRSEIKRGTAVLVPKGSKHMIRKLGLKS